LNILDTQIVSYKFNNSKDIDVSNGLIPSIVAIEFLQMQTNKSSKARYYIPSSNRIQMMDTRIDHPFNKFSTDNVLFDFNQLHAPFKLYSNYSIADLINTQNIHFFDMSVSFLDKILQKSLKKKFRFILENNIKCVPIIGNDIEIGYKLLSKFLNKYNSKNNFLNTWNDILILSKAINSKLQLITEDKLLNTFASEIYNANYKRINDVLKIDFSDVRDFEDIKSKDNKGYINNGWQYKIRKGIN